MTPAKMAHALLFHAVLWHPLPWRVEHDWTFEVTAADGTIIAKLQTAADARAIITAAEKIRAKLDRSAKDVEKILREDT